MAARPRILFVIKNLQQGGTERQLLRTLSVLDQSRFEFHLCTVSGEVQYEDLPVGEPHFRLDSPNFGGPALRGLAAVIDDYKPDVIHSFRDKVNLYVRLALL